MSHIHQYGCYKMCHHHLLQKEIVIRLPLLEKNLAEFVVSKYIQFPNIKVIPLVERKDVSFILTIFDTLFESPNIGRLEFAKKLAVASF